MKGNITSATSDDEVLQRIFDYISDHLLTGVSREDIAKHVHFHPVYLSRFFKRRTGSLLSEYILKQRIERAKSMLAEPGAKVGWVVNRLGYDNSSHFTRLFKKMTGCTPLEYRKQHRSTISSRL
ncbi:AraC family transcriptional regulator [Paenibacillus sp. YYML68]|uniref:helix-turn-helix domain-containing protein n=1 Tax=Paenibacillus sp. YYML68 TaxID=2909250 RepID=UPI00248F9BA2|nr:AraC family transcriptional regulator [Paenibacillus sp. YYML68]